MVIRKKDEILGTGDGVENVQPQRVEEALKVDSAQSAQPLVDVVTADNKAEKTDNGIAKHAALPDKTSKN